jgi:hypothetical protein
MGEMGLNLIKSGASASNGNDKTSMDQAAKIIKLWEIVLTVVTAVTLLVYYIFPLNHILNSSSSTAQQESRKGAINLINHLSKSLYRSAFCSYCAIWR